jgi:hypothetical protein
LAVNLGVCQLARLIPAEALGMMAAIFFPLIVDQAQKSFPDNRAIFRNAAFIRVCHPGPSPAEIVDQVAVEAQAVLQPPPHASRVAAQAL